jgi:chemotaxis protein MotB
VSKGGKIMFNKASFFALCLLCVVISACASQKQVSQLKTEQEVMRARLFAEQEVRHAQLKSEQEEMQKELVKLEKSILPTEKKKELFDTIDSLENELKQLQKKVQEQEDYIAKLTQEKELDEYQREIETKLQEEIERAHIEVKTSENKLKITLVGKMLFAGSDHSIKREGKHLLLKLAEYLRQHEELNIEVQGHTDSEDPDEQRNFAFNWWLSWFRAMKVVTTLQDYGINTARLKPSGFGPSRPVDYIDYWNKTEGGKSQNRRIEIILSSNIKR